ncbi:hypothetical protein ACPZ13_00820 [Streptomyces sp. IPPR8]|uniref:hypothetical protein n=1 Tax=Streptomyces TaxID=1883 RepID=UPI0004C79E83
MAQPGRTVRARRWWRTTPQLIRHFSIALLTLGALLAGTGLWLDHTNWWDGHSFLVNLVSSLTSLCFGVPTALLVLSHLGNAQADARRSRRAADFASAEIAEFHASLTSAFNTANVAALYSEVRTLASRLHQLSQLRDPDDSATVAFLNDFSALLKLVRTPLAYRSPTTWLGLSADRLQRRRIEKWHVRVDTQWRVLSNEVRPMIMDCGLPWLPRSPAAAAEQAIRRLLTPRHNPWAVEHTTFDNQDVVDAMRHFLLDLRALCATAQDLAARYPSPVEPHVP